MKTEENRGKTVWETKLTPDGHLLTIIPELKDILIKNKDKILEAMLKARNERDKTEDKSEDFFQRENI